MSTSASELVRRIRDHLRSLGQHAVIDLAALLTAADKQGIFERSQLDTVLRKGRVFLGLHDLQVVFRNFVGTSRERQEWVCVIACALRMLVRE